MRIEEQIYLDFKDVLIKPKRSKLSTRADVSLERTFICKHSKQTWTGIPIIAANMDTVGTFSMALKLSELNILTAIHKHYTEEEWVNFKNTIPKNKQENVFKNIFVTIGTSENDLKKLENILNNNRIINKICIDVANGYSDHFLKAVIRLRRLYPNYIIMAGNIVSYEMAEELIINGASIVKCGIGSGSVCTTRKMTGVGMPQLSSTIECSDAAHGLKGLVCSDGGCTNPGDISKAFCAGADFVMLGGMLAGHKESELEIIKTTIDGKTKYFMEYYGMSSSTAMNKHNGGVKEYRASEGKKVKLEYRGEIENSLRDILGGIRSTCTYIGAHKIKDMPKRATFIRVTQQINEIFGRS